MEQIKKFIEERKSRVYGEGVKLLKQEDCFELMSLFKEFAVPIYGFDGFNVGKSIKLSEVQPKELTEEGIQLNQNCSRDYSRFTDLQSWELCYEYFGKDKSESVLYEVIYKGM